MINNAINMEENMFNYVGARLIIKKAPVICVINKVVIVILNIERVIIGNLRVDKKPD